jgi:CheY-like chemotaxis protein
MDTIARASAPGASEINNDLGHAEALLITGALQSAIFNSAKFSSIATDAKGVIQIFNVGAEQGDEQRILEAGCDGYIAKPLRYREFLAAVAAQLAAT